ncbi:MAG: SPL family radical SAM protein, partial [Bradymonadia bacterium]
KQQDFRVQKQRPALILAAKNNRKVLPTPVGFGVGGEENYYFSHLLNCIYDCRYCFLQGMYRSANYVLFVNYEDFEDEIVSLAREDSSRSPYFFSGYDSDSLALEDVSQFTEYFLPIFEKYEHATLELRTKSVAIRSLLARPALKNVVVAFSLSPAVFAHAFDEKAPSIARRLDAIKRLAEAGWPIGLRFDPLIYGARWQEHYQSLLDDIFSMGLHEQIHSVSTGPLRFPKSMHKRISNLYPESLLFAAPLEQNDGVVSYPPGIELEMKDFVHQRLAQEFDATRVFHCQSEGGGS